MNLKENTERVFQQIKDASQQAGREANSVSVLAVTKYVDVPTAEALLPLGVHHIGENRVDKFLEKYEALKDRNITWHLIGTLQRRKVKDVIQYVDYFHALDSLKLAEEIQKRSDRVIKCFLQVNISKEELEDFEYLIKQRSDRDKEDKKTPKEFYYKIRKNNKENFYKLKKGDPIIIYKENIQGKEYLSFSEIPRLRYKFSPLDLVPKEFHQSDSLENLSFSEKSV